jgi:hypothetical protein
MERYRGCVIQNPVTFFGMKKTVLDLIPRHIRSLTGYVPGKALRNAQSESGVAMIKLASNENPFGPSPRAVEAIRAASDEVNFYPDNDSIELRQELARRHQLDISQIFLADGSLGMLDIMARTLLGPGLNCVTSARSFISYPLVTHAAGGELITAPLQNDAYDLNAIAAAINENTRMVILANPNNPTGRISVKNPRACSAGAGRSLLRFRQLFRCSSRDGLYTVHGLRSRCAPQCNRIADLLQGPRTGRHTPGLRMW